MSNDASLNLDSPYDCVIVGGGPAGLTCGIFLGRYRRRVLIVDSGAPRNAASHGIHGFLGNHGIAPAELLGRGQAEAESVGVDFISGSVRAVNRVGDAFEVETTSGTARGRRVVLAYGVRDILPDIPEIDQFYGSSIFHCPDCDGYEVSERKVGVIGWGRKVAGFTLALMQWTENLTVFTHGNDHELNEEEMSKLQAQGVNIQRETITALLGTEGVLRGVRLDTGERIELDALFFTIGVERSCSLAEEIGCEVHDDAPCIVVDDHKQTTIEGVYAVGDLVPGAQLVVTSAADGAIAAIAINKSLLPPARRV